MMIVAGNIVKDLAGREKGRFYIVLKICSKYVYLVDGKNRRLEKPKRKNPKHLYKTGLKSEIVINELTKDLNCENAKIRKELRKISNMEVADV